MRYYKIIQRSCHISKVIVNGNGISSNPSENPFIQTIQITSNNLNNNPFEIISDEHSSSQQGPAPYDLLLSSLGSCTSITLQMYSKRKNLLIEGIKVNLTHTKIKKEEINNLNETLKNSKNAHIDKIERMITIKGKNIKKEERERLLQIANMCPVHRTLELSCLIITSLVPESHE